MRDLNPTFLELISFYYPASLLQTSLNSLYPLSIQTATLSQAWNLGYILGPYSWYREIWSDHWGGGERDSRRRLPKAMVNSLGWDWLRSWMPPEYMELWTRRFKIKGVQRLAVWVLPQGCLDDRAAAACISQQTVFCMGRNSGCSPGSGWPGRGWQGYPSLGVLEGTSSEAEACHSSKIV